MYAVVIIFSFVLSLAGCFQAVPCDGPGCSDEEVASNNRDGNNATANNQNTQDNFNNTDLPDGSMGSDGSNRARVDAAMGADSEWFGPDEGTIVTPPGGDTSELYPIDNANSPSSPGTYKGLPLALTDTGVPDVTPVDGKIGVVCIGMSNGAYECTDFVEKIESGVIQTAANVVVVNCAVNANAIERWNQPNFDDRLWDRCIAERLPAAGLTVSQVRVIWHKAANQFPPLVFYPDPGSDYEKFQDSLDRFSLRVPEKFPNVQAVYTSSRSYGGYATVEKRAEPIAYEEGHALNQWLVSNPSVGGVWYGWGPYIWAPDCGTGVTNGSGVCYELSDYQADGVHPAGGATTKISMMLAYRFSADGWF